MYDNVEYLSSLGKAQTANVKRDAAVGVAQANRDAGIRVKNKIIILFLFFYLNSLCVSRYACRCAAGDLLLYK